MSPRIRTASGTVHGCISTGLVKLSWIIYLSTKKRRKMNHNHIPTCCLNCEYFFDVEATPERMEFFAKRHGVKEFKEGPFWGWCDYYVKWFSQNPKYYMGGVLDESLKCNAFEIFVE